MLLSGELIKKLIQDGELNIEPNPIIKEVSVKIHFNEDFVLKPKGFALVKSLEKITLSNNYAGLYDTYVGLARQGVMTHMGSMLIDPGYSGNIQLEVFNCSDEEIVIEKGMRAGHMMIMEVKTSYPSTV